MAMRCVALINSKFSTSKKKGAYTIMMGITICKQVIEEYIFKKN